jgi:plastocyanin
MRRLAVPCTLLVLLGGCGGGDDDGNARSVTVAPGETVRIEGSEYSFDPGRVVVEGAGALTIELENTGSLAHNLRLRRDGEEVGGTPTFPGGETQSGRVELEPGAYDMVCTVGDHEELGMKGELEVK